MCSQYGKQNLFFGCLERRRKFLPIYQARRIKHNILLASTDDSIIINGTPYTPFGTEVEEMRLKLDEYFQGDSIGSGLVQSIHDAARAIELAIQRQTLSSRSSWFSKAWLGVDKNAWIKRLSYQVIWQYLSATAPSYAPLNFLMHRLSNSDTSCHPY